MITLLINLFLCIVFISTCLADPIVWLTPRLDIKLEEYHHGEQKVEFTLKYFTDGKPFNLYKINNKGLGFYDRDDILIYKNGHLIGNLANGITIPPDGDNPRGELLISIGSPPSTMNGLHLMLIDGHGSSILISFRYMTDYRNINIDFAPKNVLDNEYLTDLMTEFDTCSISIDQQSTSFILLSNKHVINNEFTSLNNCRRIELSVKLTNPSELKKKYNIQVTVKSLEDIHVYNLVINVKNYFFVIAPIETFSVDSSNMNGFLMRFLVYSDRNWTFDVEMTESLKLENSTINIYGRNFTFKQNSRDVVFHGLDDAIINVSVKHKDFGLIPYGIYSEVLNVSALKKPLTINYNVAAFASVFIKSIRPNIIYSESGYVFSGEVISIDVKSNQKGRLRLKWVNDSDYKKLKAMLIYKNNVKMLIYAKDQFIPFEKGINKFELPLMYSNKRSGTFTGRLSVKIDKFTD